ncbi:hypothetical protein G3O08_02760 [Cryomorpha ignava]|uniref:DUF4177 domain-containing protein n=1 Tax=Cryomorpha ignava TaxID=101383 RepID=A0A7K3WNJ1_9FLAO|nr:hypothetical protein [Cryomorpha ignava]NEN22422.1 hypothetical protein [Cryomorpha ignava]
MLKNSLTISALLFVSLAFSQQVEYKVVTSVESIVPMGIGRSRIIESQQEISIEDLTTTRTDGKKSDQGTVNRKDAKIDHFDETKLLNFYSATGINFQNIASNDALIADKINKLVSAGWELTFVVSGVESDSGKDDGTGIFIIRYFFKRTLK